MVFNIFLLILQHRMNKLPFLPTFIGTGFGSGFWPWGPGTAGALVATLIWFAISFWVPSALTLICITAILTVVFTLLGTWATARLMPFWGSDPSRVVVDEMVGVWIPLMAAPATDWRYALAAFVLFRFFDITKPLGIRAIDRKEGAFYVMADDIAAGAYSLVILLIVRWLT